MPSITDPKPLVMVARPYTPPAGYWTGSPTAKLIEAVDGEPQVTLSSESEHAVFVQLPEATGFETYEFCRHPDGGMAWISVEQLPDGSYLVVRRVYFLDGDWVGEEPIKAKLPGAYDSMVTMRDYVHLSKSNDNTNSSGLGYQIYKISDLSLMHTGTTHLAELGITGFAYISITASVRNTFYFRYTETGQYEWMAGLKVLPDGGLQRVDLTGIGPATSANYIGSRFINSVYRRNEQTYNWAVFRPRESGTTYYYDAHLLNEDGRVVVVTFPVLDYWTYRTVSRGSTFGQGIMTYAWSIGHDESGREVAKWWGWQETYYTTTYGGELHQFWGSFVIPDSGHVDAGVEAGYPLSEAVPASPQEWPGNRFNPSIPANGDLMVVDYPDDNVWEVSHFRIEKMLAPYVFGEQELHTYSEGSSPWNTHWILPYDPYVPPPPEPVIELGPPTARRRFIAARW